MIPEDGLPTPKRYWAYAAVVIAITLAVIDSTVANVALPTIAGEFHATPSASITIVSDYQLAIVISLLPLSALGEIKGYRRIYMGGVALFTVASLLCATSRSIETLTAARIVQGFGAAGIMSMNTALMRIIFPQARLGAAIGVNALVVAIGSTVGPTFASVVLGIASWPWLFAVNVPIGILAYVIAARNLPENELSGRKFDIPSAILTAVTTGIVITLIDSISRHAPLPVLGAEIAGGVLAGVWSVGRQAHLTAPLLPIDLLRIPMFSLSLGTSICSFSAQMISFTALPFLLQGTLGFSAAEIGFLIAPWSLALACVAPLSGRLADRFPPALLCGIGLSVLALGLVLLATMQAHPGVPGIVMRMIVCGIGFGMFQPPNNRAIIFSAPRKRSGAASGMLATARLFGQATGAALTGLMLVTFGRHGPGASLYAAAIFSMTAALVSLSRLRLAREKTG